MRDAIDVTVQRTIVHIVDHRKKRLVLSEAELRLEGNDALRNYFSEQVKNALADSQTGAARFADTGPQAARNQCALILQNRNNLIPASQELAKLLFQAMGTNVAIAPGSLAVCIYTASNHDTDFLALIKLDPGSALVQKEADSGGKHVVTFEVRDDVMPTAQTKLQKGALIQPSSVQPHGSDLLLLDRQAAGVAANFFAFGFLNTELVFDSITATKLFYIAAQNAYNRLVTVPPPGTKPLDPKDADKLQQQIDQAVATPTLEIPAWVKSLPKAARVAAAEEIEKKLPNVTSFEVALDFAEEKLLSKRRFRGGHGVLFEVNADAFDDVVKSWKDIQKGGTIVSRVTIEVPGLQWVK